MKATTVFQYIDYREYLREYFLLRKRSDPKFSHRYLARRLGLSAPNFMMMVMQGKRNLTPSLAFKLSGEFRHTPEEADYFRSMVGFDKAETTAEKNSHFRHMAELRRKAAVDKIDEQQYEYYSNWYNLAVRELVTFAGFKNDYRRLARMVRPPITPAQARRSVELLLRLGLIRRNGDAFERVSTVITTGPQVTSLAVANFHRAMAGLAADSIDRTAAEERDLTACTISISPAGFEVVRDMIADCRRKVLAVAEADLGAADRVYHAAFQLFPVSEFVEIWKEKAESSSPHVAAPQPVPGHAG